MGWHVPSYLIRLIDITICEYTIIDAGEEEGARAKKVPEASSCRVQWGETHTGYVVEREAGKGDNFPNKFGGESDEK